LLESGKFEKAVEKLISLQENSRKKVSQKENINYEAVRE